ncbi:replicative DNA helicase [Solitalea canadensis]|uniref:Replicative DNA helicase n=1 Tax=Solitalea canadensis (strain ATCC 29591 / DSM 3403 / JCM 21819 / LMG 8368 / NBRC 15130 / NCIMB 12057 / USAM 9D) TaxID=929556 RepID=H8KQV2_SOLCM|nr:replicative DNA helicase [Solitalea canadensis]AFD06973.1 replicative DNA helicase [Solitalea canadensis DSM 3403]
MSTDNFDSNSRSKTDRRSTGRKSPAQLIGGKLPPQAVELEEAVLGSIMIEKNALTSVIEFLRPEIFYKDAHQKIFKAIMDLYSESSPVDILTVTNQLRKSGDLEMVGGAFYITELTNRVASAANIEFHARIVAQKYLQRQLIEISTETVNMAYEDTTDIFELLDKAEGDLFKITEGNLRRNAENMADLVKKAVIEIEKLKDKTDGLTGVPSGFTALDRVTSGWQKSDLVIIAARPAMGKTAFILSAVRNAAVGFNFPVAVFSLEMSSVQLVNRLIAGEAELEAEKLKKGNLAQHEWQQLHSKVGKLAEAPIYIDDTPGLNVFELRAKVRRMKQQYGIQMIVIDYLQLMHGSGDAKGNREQEISGISRALKGIAKELNVPVIALSQLSRAVETRGGDKKPMLSDLRESGSIEQDADMVLFLYRPEYYGFTQDESGRSTAGVAEVIIAKHRNGSLENVPLKFVGKYIKYQDLDPDNFDFGGFDSANLNAASGLTPSAGFDDERPQNFIIRPSKMNEFDDGNDDFAPF